MGGIFRVVHTAVCIVSATLSLSDLHVVYARAHVNSSVVDDCTTYVLLRMSYKDMQVSFAHSQINSLGFALLLVAAF